MRAASISDIPVGPRTEAIIAKRQSALTTLADLKGRTIAVQQGSSAHYLLLESLERSGLRLNDLQINYLQPAYARAAFAADRIDAWSIWDPHLAGVEAEYPLRTLADYSTLSPVFGFYIAARRFAEQRPDAVAHLLDEIATAGAWAAANPDAAAASLAPLVGLPVAVAEICQRRTRYGVMPVDDKVLAVQQGIADLFLRHGSVPQKPSRSPTPSGAGSAIEQARLTRSGCRTIGALAYRDAGASATGNGSSASALRTGNGISAVCGSKSWTSGD